MSSPARQPFGLAALKDAAIAALITLGLFAPVMGLRTAQDNSGLTIVENWWPVLVAVAVVFFGRLILNAFFWSDNGFKVTDLIPRGEATAKVGETLAKLLAPVLIIVAIGLPLIPGLDRYYIDLGILVLTYVMLGWGLNIVVGLAGLLDLGYVAFYAVGAYSFALIATVVIPNYAPGLELWAFWICLPLAGLLAAFWGIILGFPVLRLRGDYLAIVTLAFGEIIRIVLLNWYEFTGGPNGINRIPDATFFGLEFKRNNGFADFFGLDYSSTQKFIFLYYLILVLAFLTNFATIRLRRLPIGRAWEAMREDEIACRSLGLSIVKTKLTAFALGAMFGGFAGSFFATKQGFISPESFSFIESANILAIVVLGGMGSQLGIAIAALVMVGGFEYFREFEQYRMLVFGLAMVLIMIWRPRGLISSRTATVFLKEKKTVSADMVAEGRG
ncbi:branched-chain amino acid ABC transporter permease [Agaricicola taiwanensis]|uniref:Branched-chain amino acid ABC transporter permease n=1 Tax=Agaricicola taiwanensis TaxID=591372 RepID=A0A8J2VZW6_9RHOB|nr:high-affinity branched-chain amino acid ABC transporter permease LivM [Agaricicola taiwanensis]GGE41988.1 branched-chain amino acid ABC transporter permease [Agaricicola taiwanensis]